MEEKTFKRSSSRSLPFIAAVHNEFHQNILFFFPSYHFGSPQCAEKPPPLNKIWVIFIEQLFFYPMPDTLWTFCGGKNESDSQNLSLHCRIGGSALGPWSGTVIFIPAMQIIWKSLLSLCRLCRWWVGDWHKCSASCGSLGQAKRTVLCVRAVGAEEQEALDPRDCKHIPKPESTSACNTHIPCPANWNAGSWSKVSFHCPQTDGQKGAKFVSLLVHHISSDFSVLSHVKLFKMPEIWLWYFISLLSLWIQITQS